MHSGVTDMLRHSPARSSWRPKIWTTMGRVALSLPRCRRHPERKNLSTRSKVASKNATNGNGSRVANQILIRGFAMQLRLTREFCILPLALLICVTAFAQKGKTQPPPLSEAETRKLEKTR